MEKGETKKKFKEFIANAGQKAKDIAEDAGHKAKDVADNAIKAIDQDDDGKFNIADMSIIAENVGHVAKKGANAVAEGAQEAARKYELKTLAPLFNDDLSDVDFALPKLIRVVDRDKKHADSEVCKGSIGHKDTFKGYTLINIYRDSLDVFNLQLTPDAGRELYYVDPIERDCYIALNDYFVYLKNARVAELQMIAQSLGAKYFKVTSKEEQATFTESKAKRDAKAVKNTVGITEEQSKTETKYSHIQVESEMSFPGQDPVMPSIKYLKNNPQINSLIQMRMHETSPLLEQHITIRLEEISGIKGEDAIKIDAVLKGLKCGGNMTLQSEVQNEARRILEYDIKF